MLPKNRRIPRKLFSTIVERGRYSHSQHFSLRTVVSKELRVAVSVSKKVSKQAVVRNRVRRRAYSVLQGIIPSLHNGLYFLSAKIGAERVKGEELKKELSSLLTNKL